VQDDKIIRLDLCEDALEVCLPEAYRDMGSSEIEISELRGEKWILDGAGTPFAEHVIELCRSNGFEPTVIARVRSPFVASGLVAAGCGIAVLPGLLFTESGLPAGTITKRLMPASRRRIYSAHRAAADRTPAVRAVLKQLRTSVETVRTVKLATVPRNGSFRLPKA
jgi:DNA-binding transcriptional LysR family regulator